MIPQPEVQQVEQTDREAAAELVEWQQAATAQWQQEGEPAWSFFAAAFPASIRAGSWDEHDVVQAFARHRAAAFEAGRAEGVREAAVMKSVWPMGHGVVATAVGNDDLAGKVLFVGVPDVAMGAPGNDFESLWRSGAPRMILSFADIGAIDRLKITLDQAAEEIRALSKEPTK